jgi:hypothetical protein
MCDQPVARPLPINRTTQTQNKRTETLMPRVGFETTTPVFKRAKTVHAIYRAATVIGTVITYIIKKKYKQHIYMLKIYFGMRPSVN